MSTNYTPLDLKRIGTKKAQSSKTLNIVLIFIGIITAIVLSVLVYMLYQKSSGI